MRIRTSASMRSAIATLSLATMAAVALPASAATAEPQPAAQFQCGFHVDGNLNALYGHCDAPPRTDIVINVELGWGGDSGNYDKCVKPGLTTLGKYPSIWYAKYTGRLCSAG
ncbi:hypothetical protein HD597_004342 [Nonomuraea thailandensis]|uniref:Secreted protein n=1 Tax=Nonomuraea thailandensis TaxID=1188745 RepID=A0A9X2K1H5_9ACTN|nr:DUF6355 family natural product biosynthesis protein [Nonomuraea thailandensis]MCP2357322.1 hypothetical protein [Nonomuraea thailandensis]